MNLPAPRQTMNKWIWVFIKRQQQFVVWHTHIYLSIQQTQNIHLEHMVCFTLWVYMLHSVLLHLFCLFCARLHIYNLYICFFFCALASIIWGAHSSINSLPFTCPLCSLCVCVCVCVKHLPESFALIKHFALNWTVDFELCNNHNGGFTLKIRARIMSHKNAYKQSFTDAYSIHKHIKDNRTGWINVKHRKNK